MSRLALACLGVLLAALTPVAAAADRRAETVVLKDFAALGSGDVDGLAAQFAPQFEMYGLPAEPLALEGKLSTRMRTREELRAFFRTAFLDQPPAPHRVEQMLSLGDLVVVRVATHLPDGTPPDHAFTAFRVGTDGIERIWHIAREADAGPQSGQDALEVVRRLGEANNRGDAEAFVALYHPQAKHFHARHARDRFGGAESATPPDADARLRYYRELYARGAPAQVSLIDSVALGEWVAALERYRGGGRPEREHLSLYRVRDGAILAEWHVAP
ncbi:nuclear transport factor 2 family protein [Lysobacter silvisoli]|uniref:nuclear transport factor 2 family protein n=1 Tax=Lysobacter silvisoli TaxID=2293254 RepID=UPI0011C06255|nr:nuclear transport factor 2 family protein [Lysobacter silvisoli]